MLHHNSPVKATYSPSTTVANPLPSRVTNHSSTTNSSSTSPVSTTTVLLRNNVNPNETFDYRPQYGNSASQSNVNTPPTATLSLSQSNKVSTTSTNNQNQNTTTNNVSTNSQSQAYHHNVLNATSTMPGHSFLSAVSEVRNMETALLSLLADFNSGELSAFGSGRTLETMEAIRSKQERLARLHFDLASGNNDDRTSTSAGGAASGKDNASGSKQGEKPQGSQQNTTQNQTSSWMSESDQNKLVAGLRELSVDIEKLHEHEIVGSKRASTTEETKERETNPN